MLSSSYYKIYFWKLKRLRTVRSRMQRLCLIEQGSHVMRRAHFVPQLVHIHPFHSCKYTSWRNSNANIIKVHTLISSSSSRSSKRSDGSVNSNVNIRSISWLGKLFRNAQVGESHTSPSDGQDEAARSAILEKVMKGRQPTDLMLRCTFLLLLPPHFCLIGSQVLS